MAISLNTQKFVVGGVEVQQLVGTDDPSVVGAAANEGSIYLRYGVGAGQLWLKTGAVATNWLRIPTAGVGVRAFHNAAQAIPNSISTALALNSERFDTSIFHDNAVNNSRITVPIGQAGTYVITASAEFVGSIVGVRVLSLRLNGVTTIASTSVPGTATNNTLTIHSLYSLIVGDYVEAIVFQSTGGALNVNNTANFSPEFGAWRVV